MASLPAKSPHSTAGDTASEFLDLSSALLEALAAERRAQSNLIALVAQAAAEGERQQRLLAR